MSGHLAYSGDELPDFDRPIPSIPAWAVAVGPRYGALDVHAAHHQCKPCQVKWTGDAFCWNCGGAV